MAKQQTKQLINQSLINVSPVSNFGNGHEEFVMLDLIDNAINTAAQTIYFLFGVKLLAVSWMGVSG